MKNVYIKFYFENGYVIICKGMSRHEKKVNESKYGKIVKTEYEK